MRLSGAIAMLGFAAVGTQAESAFLVTVEKAGVQSTTSTFNFGGTENFNSLATTGSSQTTATTNFSSNFGGTSSGVQGAYTTTGITAADVYGGAGGSGNFALSKNGGSGTSSLSIGLSSSNTQGINYFGIWISALDSGNTISFYQGSSLVYTFSAGTLLNFINAQSNSSAYYGNPNGGGDGGEAFAYVNFYDQGSVFNKIVLSENLSGAGFESDNHTVGNYKTVSGYTVVGAIPEPATWSMMIVGFGSIGMWLRSRKRPAATAQA